jgi:hypothetical protein
LEKGKGHDWGDMEENTEAIGEWFDKYLKK